jgi:hypothetical protein
MDLPLSNPLDRTSFFLNNQKDFWQIWPFWATRGPGSSQSIRKKLSSQAWKFPRQKQSGLRYPKSFPLRLNSDPRRRIHCLQGWLWFLAKIKDPTVAALKFLVASVSYYSKSGVRYPSVLFFISLIIMLCNTENFTQFCKYIGFDLLGKNY